MKINRGNSQIIIVSVAVVLIFILFVFLVWRLEFFKFSGTAPSATIVAASIALFGGLFTSIVSIIGLALKHSIDLRNLAIQDRNEALAKEAEKRQKEEAAIKSIALLGNSEGAEASNIQQAGVILSLANLEKFRIALPLAEQMINNSAINASTFCWLIDKAVLLGNDQVKIQACLALGNQIEKLITADGGAFYPSCLLDLKTHTTLPSSAQGHNITILIDLITANPFINWNKDTLAGIIGMLFSIYKEDKTFLRDKAGIASFYFIKKYPEDSEYYWDNKLVRFNDLIDEVADYEGWSINNTSFLNGAELSINVKNWFEDKEVKNKEIGALKN